MTDVIASAEAVEEVQPAGMPEALDDQLTGQLVDRAKAGGIKLTGEGGLLQQLTRRLSVSTLRGSPHGRGNPVAQASGDPSGRSAQTRRSASRRSPSTSSDPVTYARAGPSSPGLRTGWQSASGDRSSSIGPSWGPRWLRPTGAHRLPGVAEQPSDHWRDVVHRGACAVAHR